MTQDFYRNFRAFVRRVKADPRFEIADTLAEKAKLKPRVALTKKDIPAVRRALLADFGAIDAPDSWCVADVFQAAVRLLRGETEALPDKVYGFLERPVGVKEQTTVKAADLCAAAAKLDLATFIPSQIAARKSKLTFE